MDKDRLERLLKKFADMACDCSFGESIVKGLEEYKQLPSGIAPMLKYVTDFCEENSKIDLETRKIRNLICKGIILAYREAKSKNPLVASALLFSFVEDYPDIPDTCLLPCCTSLINACLAYKEIMNTENRLLIWEGAKRVNQSYNEFLNGLISYLYLCWQTYFGKTINTNVFTFHYGNKIKEFSNLTGGEDGVFFIFLRIAKPKIRNAIAHESIYLEYGTNKVIYIDGQKEKIEYDISLEEFILYAYLGSHLAPSYLAAISIISIMEFGTDFAKSLLPKWLKDVFEHKEA